MVIPGDEVPRAFGLERARGIWRRWKWLAIVIFASGFSVAAGTTLFLPSLYRSTATVLVERQGPEAFVRPAVTGELDTRLHTLSQEILGRPRLESLITQFNLYPDLRRRQSTESLTERLRRDVQLELKGVQQTGGRSATIAFTLSYLGRDPQTVARVTNTLASFYVEENVKVRERQASGTAEFLKQQMELAKKRLDEHEARVTAFKLRYMGDLPQQVSANLATLSRLSDQLSANNAGQTRLLERRNALTRQLAEVEQPFATVEPDATAARIAKLNQELLELRTRFTEKYPDIIRVKTEIAALQRQLAEARSGAARPADPSETNPSGLRLQEMLDELDAELRALKTEDERLRRDIASYQRRVENAPQREQELLQLSRDYDTVRELYSSLLKRYEDAELAENMEQRQRTEHFRIVDPAIAAKQPVAPNRPRLLVVGLLLSLGLAVGAVVIGERLDASFHTVDELRTFTEVPVVGRVPRIRTRADARRQLRRFLLTAVATLLAQSLILGVSYYVVHENEQLVFVLTQTRH